MALTLLELVPHLRRMRLQIAHSAGEGSDGELRLEGAATFVQLPRITRALEKVPDGGVLRLDTQRLSCLDHTCAEVIDEWLKAKRRAGTTVEVSPGPFAARLASA